MSLFGDDYAGPPSRSGAKSSLFDDSSAPTNGTSNGAASKPPPSSSMFGDDDPQAAAAAAADGDDDASSPWAAFTPRKPTHRSGASVVRALLSDAEVPESYVEAWDALAAGRNGVEEAEARRVVIEGSGVRAEVGERIWSVVSGGGESRVLGRGQCWVLFALVGLAREGEEVGLDAVDERRGRLPELPPALEGLGAKKEVEAEQRRQEERPVTPVQQQQGAQRSPARERGAGRKPSFGFGESDPWASPEMHRGHAHANGAAVAQAPAPAMRTTSAFSSTAQGNGAGNGGGGYASQQTGVSEAGSSWGASNAYTAAGGSGGFGTTPEEGDGFGEGNGGAHNVQRAAGPRVTVPKGVEEVITIAMLEEKEGMFLFQHRNYEVASVRRNSKVIRRYSDFVWLLDCLHKRYPFRQLPLLPPKRMAINGNHIAADSLFIEKRRRGLVRFANALVRHPVLREEQLVVMFLTVPTELAVWRKQATISVQEEFIGRSLPPSLEDSLPQNLQDTFDTVRSGVRRSADLYINLCNLVERLCKRKEAIAAEYGRFGMNLTSITETTNDAFAIDQNDVPLLNEGIKATAKHLGTSQSLLEDEGRAWDEGVLEDLKSVRDGLVSLRDLFDRKDRLARDNIPQLEKRILQSENKLQGIKAKGDAAKPGEAEKVENSIVNDKQSIVNQHARGVFIKECVRDEIVFFQSTIWRISRAHQEWAQERVKYAELQADCWRGLVDGVEGMPLGD
ncbi:hypothetical protein WHR41_01126 [Cladosporium halotolerans]|uniref:Sorting nexin MVP1 n=1 Tax=Cladosporium halotolerans TaxID=1052096 RepID=A0AB34L174_9PEZI